VTKLIAISYSDNERAKQALQTVDWLNFEHLLEVTAACWVERKGDEVVIHPRGAHPVAAKGTLGGALGLIVGGLVGLPMVGLAAGSAIGARKGAKIDSGIDQHFIDEVSGAIDAGGSAIFVLVERAQDPGRSLHEITQFGGTVHSTDLTPEQMSEFQTMLDRAGETDAAANPAI